MLLEVILLSLVLFALFIYVRSKWAFRSLDLRGPPPTLFFGNYLEILDLMPKFAEVNFKKYGNVFGFFIGAQPTIAVKDLDILKQVLVKQFDDFIDRPHSFVIINVKGKSNNNVMMDRGESWRRQRKLISKNFTAFKLNRLSPIIDASCVSLANKIGEYSATGKSFDIWKLYGLYTMEVILATGFGHKVDVINGQFDDLVNSSQCFLQSVVGSEVSTLMLLSNLPFLKGVFNRLALMSQRAKAFFHIEKKARELIHDRIQHSDGSVDEYQDLLQLLIDSKIDDEDNNNGGSFKGKLTEDEIISNSVMFIVAGHETTNNSLGYTSYLLALHPTEQDKVLNEIDEYFNDNPEATLLDASQNVKYLDMVIQEALRIYPPVPLVARHVMKDTVINGVKFPKDARLVAAIKEIHYSPEIWPDPLQFKPERFTREEKEKRHSMAHMPFGWGPRSCIGMRLSMMEAKMALIAILKEYKFVEAPETEKPLKTSHIITMYPVNGIHLIAQKRL